MNRSSLILTVCLGIYLVYLPLQILAENTSLTVVNSCVASKLSTVQLHSYAKSITVKVFSGDTWGSGILIHKQGQDYGVLTNDHVLIPGQGKPYRIQTPDGRIYTAVVVEAAKFEGQDLALLKFFSPNKKYQVASLQKAAKLSENTEVFAAGFPLDSTNFLFTQGQIKLLLNQPLKGGFQIGYSNEIQKGMSGGPVLNRQGQVIAINGRHSYPLWGNPYVFENGEIPSAAIQKQMMKLSWAVPIQTFIKMAPKSILVPGC
ncbi:trypsin-like peptidase domain-containing protein [Desmonostoc muscorum CCALA 125]|nr:trypsin-like peptidase domain-containing protein [Desmonostoc muscorum CCALA 125]